MANKFLTREDAPIEGETWEILDRVMLESVKAVLSGRRILHIEGPYGLGMKTVSLEDPEAESGPIRSPVMPLVLVQTTFTLAKRDLAAFERDKTMLNTKRIGQAAVECARREDSLVYNGMEGLAGLLTVPGASQLDLSPWDEVGMAADDIIKGVTMLDGAGFHGPYSLALAPARYNLLLRRYPSVNLSELQHIETMATAGVVKAPILESVVYSWLPALSSLPLSSGRIWLSALSVRWESG